MPNPGVVKSEMSGVKCQVSCYDIAGCDLSFGTWLTTTTRAKRRCRERPLQCCRTPLSPMTPFSRRKQSEPVDPPHSYRPCTLRAFRARRILPKILKENDIRRSSFRLVLASEVAVAFALLSPVPSASSIGICERQQPWGRVTAAPLPALQTCVACGDPWSEFPVARSTLGRTVRGGLFSYATPA